MKQLPAVPFDDTVPDHSTFSKNRHGRFRESDAFRQVFERVVERCMKEGLVGGEGFAVDASVIKADANRSRSTGREGGEVLVIDTPLIKERIVLERIGFDDLVFANEGTDPRLPPAGGQGRNAHETVVSG